MCRCVPNHLDYHIYPHIPTHIYPLTYTHSHILININIFSHILQSTNNMTDNTRMQSLGGYIVLTIAILFLFLAFSHFMNYTKITNEPLAILQSEQPVPDVIESMMEKRQPIIFLYELELWDGIDLLIGYPYDEISAVLKDNRDLIRAIKTTYLRPFSLSFTKDWKITLENKTDTWDVLQTTPLKETAYGHFIANLSGLMVVCIIHPTKINKSGPSITELVKSGFDFKTALATQQDSDTVQDSNTASDPATNTTLPADDPTRAKFDYITVPVRPSNMIYIPYGWYYWIYCGQTGSYCTYLDIYNLTWFG